MILLTGATGFVGRSLANRLTQQEREWQPYNGRINDPFTLRPQLEGVDTVFHLAGTEARGRDRLLRRIDVAGTERLLRECRRAQVSHFILISRIGADPNSMHPLLRAKGEMEQQVRQSGVPYTILRSATLFGRNDRFTEIILGLAIWSWPFVWLPGGGTVAMQPLWVEDLARCLAAIPDRPDLIGKTVTLAGEERLHYLDIVRQILTATGYQRGSLKIPLVMLRPLSNLLFRWWRWPAVSRYFVDRFFVPEVAQIDSVLRLFDFRPARLADTIAYLHRPRLRWRLFRH